MIKQIEVARSGLQASLLVRHPDDSKEVYVNFDPHILILIRETECMEKMSLDVPYTALPFKQKQSVFKENFNKLQVMQDPKYTTVDSL